MPRLFSVLLVLLAASILSAPLFATNVQASEAISVPARISETNHFLIDAMVNGQGPYTFVVDTAAGSTVVFESFAAAADLPAIESNQRVMVQGASGLIEARMVTLGTLNVGDWHFEVGPVVAMPDVEHLSESVGVLGVGTLFSQPVGFASAENRLDIYPADEAFMPPEASNWTAVSVTQPRGPLLWGEAEINGVPFAAVIDTGARRSTINLAGSAALGVADPAAAGLAEEEPIRGATGHPEPAWSLPVESVTLGDMAWSDGSLTVSDMSVFHMFGQTDTPTIVLGADFLLQQYMVVDAGAQQLWFLNEG